MDDRTMLEPFEEAIVLIVEDNEMSVGLLRATLSRAGLVAVHAVTDSELAIDAVKELRPDLILLDLHMPKVDGYQVLSQLRQLDDEVPVLVLTADTTREASHRALTLGANDFLTKPVDTIEVTLRVRTLLHTRSLQASLRQRQRWLEASREVAQALIVGSGDEPARVIATRAQDVASADLAASALVTRGGEPSVITSVALDFDGEDVRDIARAITSTLSVSVINSGEPIVIEDFTAAAHNGVRPPGLLDVGPVLVVPLRGTHQTVGALCLCRGVDRRPFSATEVDSAMEYGHQAAIGMELAHTRELVSS